MKTPQHYTPGPADLARVQKDGENWTLVLVRQLRHSPQKVWRALTDPAQLREWAPFDADVSMGVTGSTVKLKTVGTPTPLISETIIKRADEPNVLEYRWGDGDLRWELEDFGGGTRLTLWHNIDRRFISMGAAGWHICLDVLDHALSGVPLGRIVGPEVMKFEGWQRLNADYAKQFVRGDLRMSIAKGIVVSSWFRQFHRWVSIAFTATVIANFVVRIKGTPPAWVTYSPLLPLGLLLLTGLYLFALPYTAKQRIRRIA